MRIAPIGGSGLIGTACAEAALAAGHSVTLISRTDLGFSPAASLDEGLARDLRMV